MSTTLLSNGTMIIDDETRAEAALVVDTACDHDLTTFTVLAGGKQIEVPPHLSEFLVRIMERVAENRAMNITSLPDELTTTAAADLLSISRPTLMKLIRNGDLPSKKVNTHTRVLTADVVAFRESRRASRFEAMKNLRAASDELDEE